MKAVITEVDMADLETGVGASSSPGSLAVTIHNVTYHISTRRQKQLFLLQGVSAYLRPATMTAVLGPSGSGKTTLLDILAGRKTVGRLDPASAVLFNGCPATPALLRHRLGYVEQHSELLSLLTPRETLMYTALLTSPRRQPKADTQLHVNTLLKRLGLLDCQDTLVGSPMQRGISGGEAKRVAIAIALINPSASVLLCDEPSSGLDSLTAHGVITVIKGLVASGITICSTIHSPLPLTFELFDQILVLQKGRVVYFGPNGEPAMHYFQDTFPELRRLRPAEGLADFIIEATTVTEGSPQPDFAGAYAASELSARNEKALQDVIAEHQVDTGVNGREPGGAGRLASLLRFDQNYGTVTPMWRALLVLWRYRSLHSFKRFAYIGPRMLDKVLIVFIVVTLYWGVGDQLDPGNVTNVSAILFMWTVLTAFGSMGLLPSLVLERPIYLRERADGLYRPITYLVFKLTEELAVAILASIPYSLLVFYLVSLQGSFVLFWLVYVVSISISVSLAFLFAAASPNLDVAGASLPSYTTALLYFAGFLLTWDQIPAYWKWWSVITYLRYAWGALMVNQWEGTRDIVVFGEATVLEYYSLDAVDKWAWLGYELIFFAVFVFWTWIALVLVKHHRR